MRDKEDGVGGQKMKNGINWILKEGGDGIGLWMLTLGGVREGRRETKRDTGRL